MEGLFAFVLLCVFTFNVYEFWRITMSVALIISISVFLGLCACQHFHVHVHAYGNFMFVVISMSPRCAFQVHALKTMFIYLFLLFGAFIFMLFPRSCNSR